MPLPFLSPLFGDNLVLQRGQPNRFWGWAQPGQEVSVSIEREKSKSAIAGRDGRWNVTMAVPPVGGPLHGGCRGTA